MSAVTDWMSTILLVFYTWCGSSTNSISPDNMVHFSPLAAEMCWWVWVTQIISANFASWQHYCTALW